MTYAARAAWLARKYDVFEIDTPGGPIPAGWITTREELASLQKLIEQRRSHHVRT